MRSSANVNRPIVEKIAIERSDALNSTSSCFGLGVSGRILRQHDPERQPDSDRKDHVAREIGLDVDEPLRGESGDIHGGLRCWRRLGSRRRRSSRHGRKRPGDFKNG
jgi:hypothetical protein